MSRINDVGGMHGFGAIDVSDDGQPFHNEWEARVLGINRLLLAAGIYNLDEFRDALERMGPAAYLNATYYERWFAGIERILTEKGLIDDV
jgi:nitrile hydratase